MMPIRDVPASGRVSKIIDQAQYVPNRVIKEWMFLTGAIGAQNSGVVRDPNRSAPGFARHASGHRQTAALPSKKPTQVYAERIFTTVRG